jgi:chromosome segregation protein
MHLKRLTVQGFKSFLNRTTFEYADGVTAVVGPNGSGKSNVADAIRWVLGEQSSRLLRARKQEDVIFAGTRDRGPVGMAEVILTLDNSEHWLPVEFAEVEFGRRLYRDGESEYLLNGQRVRLRDLIETLAKADLGQNSYAILGQGLVDEVLSMNPEERRAFLDEAAGVRRFRVRIEEAQARLAATRENVGRVILIVNELEPRLRQLSRQAERAAEHARLSAELGALLRVYFADRYSDAQNRLVGARARLDQVHAESQSASARVDTLRDQLKALSEEIRRRREAIARSEGQRAELANRVRESEQALALQQERQIHLEQRKVEVDAELAALELEAEAAGLPHPGEVDREETLARDAAAAAEEVETKRAHAAAAEQDWRASVAAYEAARGRDTADARATAGFREEISRVLARIRQIDDQEQMVDPRRAQLLADLRAYGAQYLALAQQAAEAEIALDASREQAKRARERLARVKDEVSGVEELTRRESREFDLLQGRLEALRRVQAEYDGLAAGTRSALILGGVLSEGIRPAQQPDVPGMVGLLARKLHVPHGLEAAVNAALESRLHAVVVDSEEAALQAIALLREGRHGRAQFIALDRFRHVYPLNLQKERGVVGVASRLVRCPKEVQPVVDTLLGRVIVCEDHETARRMLKRALGACVTLDGTFYEGTGIVVGGVTGSDEGPFGRQREIEELPRQIDALRHRVAANERRLAEGFASIERLELEARESDTIDSASRRDLDSLRAALERERTRLGRLRSEAGAQRLRLSEAEKERARLEETLTQARAAINEIERHAAENAAAVREAEPAVHEAEQRRTVALAALAEANSRLAAIEAERGSLAMLAEQRARAIERVRQQATARREQAQRLADQVTASLERIAGLEIEISARRAEAAAGGPDAEPDRHELDRLESHERQVQDSFAHAQQVLLAVDRRRLDLESEIERTEAELRSLEDDMSREGLVPDRRGSVAGFDESPAASPIGGAAAIDHVEVKAQIDDLRRQIRRLGPINDEAPQDYGETRERYEFLTGQLADLEAAEIQLREAIAELSAQIRERFDVTFERVNAAFGEYFTAFFGGGQASLVLTDPSNSAESGVEIEAQPPGKKVKSLALLSGGERSLTAVALLFALLKVNPAPFCVLDEVDAALDEANVGRFVESLRKLAASTQFIIITHNRRTVEAADAIYGVSMNTDGISRVLSLKLEDVPAN